MKQSQKLHPINIKQLRNRETVDYSGDIDKMQLNSYDIRILTIKEVAKLLRVHRTTISRYAMSGELKSYLIGNRRLFKESDVLMFFENQVDLGCVFEKEINNEYGNDPKTQT